MPTPSLIDAHCHLDFEAFDHDRKAVMQRAKENNITDIIIPGTEKVYWDRVKNLCTEQLPADPKLHACYGLHPYWANKHHKQDIDKLRECIDTASAIAIGECGLDFRPHQADNKTQLYFFEAQLEIAEDSRLPGVIHSVRATETVSQMIKKWNKRNGIFHSYSGRAEQARQLDLEGVAAAGIFELDLGPGGR